MKAPPAAQTRVHRPSERTLRMLAGVLQSGGLVAVPTETVYGLAGNALDPRACKRIFTAKRRPTNDPLIVHLHSAAQLDTVAEPSEAALKLAAAFWPGPLTLVLKKKAVIPDLATAGRDSVAVRVPAHRVFRRLLKLAGLPLAAPSANPFGYISPTTAAHVLDSLGGRIEHILDGGAAQIGVESTIVDIRDPRKPVILRPGAITRQDLERILGRRVIARRRATNKGAMPAPGMLSRHYSPRTPLLLHDHLTVQHATANEAVIFLRKPRGRLAKNVFWFDRAGDLRRVARSLFATLRKLDRVGYRRLHSELAQGDELAEAINDRLRRAAAR